MPITGTSDGPCECCAPCALECREKSDIAVLCGFEPLYDCGTLQRFRRREIMGEMTIDEFVSACVEGGPNAAGEVIAPALAAFSLRLNWNFTYNPSTNQVSMTLTRHGGFDPGHAGGSYVWSIEYSIQDNLGNTIVFGTLAAGPGITDSHILGPYTAPGSMQLKLVANGRHVGNGSATTFPDLPIVWDIGETPETTVDTWDLTQDYTPGFEEDPPECVITETDDSIRTNPDTSTEPIPVGNPSGYDSGHIDETAGSCPLQTNTVEGNEDCVDVGATYKRYTGTVVETLSDEDTDEDAIERMNDTLEWSGTDEDCIGKTAYISERAEAGSDIVLAYRSCQVNVPMEGLTIGEDYELTVYFTRRVFGSMGPFVAFSDITVTFTATATTMDSKDIGGTDAGWIDVPNESGFETLASSCAYGLVE